MVYKVWVFYVMFSVVEPLQNGQSSAAVISGQLNVSNVSDVGGRKLMSVLPTSNSNTERQPGGYEEVNCRVTEVTGSADKHCSVLSLKAPQIKVVPT